MDPAEQTVMQIARGYQLSQALYVAAKLGVADVVGPQPLAAEAIARAVGRTRRRCAPAHPAACATS